MRTPCVQLCIHGREAILRPHLRQRKRYHGTDMPMPPHGVPGRSAQVVGNRPRYVTARAGVPGDHLLGITLIAVVLLLLATALHGWERRRTWRYHSGSGLSVVLILLVVLLFLGRI
jgi:Protein of unknown function (DUF3309)